MSSKGDLTFVSTNSNRFPTTVEATEFSLESQVVFRGNSNGLTVGFPSKIQSRLERVKLMQVAFCFSLFISKRSFPFQILYKTFRFSHACLALHMGSSKHLSASVLLHNNTYCSSATFTFLSERS